MKRTSPLVIDMMIGPFLLDDVLQSAYNEVIMAKQKDQEDKACFAERVLHLRHVIFGIYSLHCRSGLSLRTWTSQGNARESASGPEE